MKLALSTLVLAFVLPLFGGGTLLASETKFVRGDANADGKINVADPIMILFKLFLDGPAFPCKKAADADDNGEIAFNDAVYLVTYYFQHGNAPHAPFPACGTDPTADALDCGSFPTCVGK